MEVVCDRCKVKVSIEDLSRSMLVAFMRRHMPHNFTGLRIVPTNNISPNLVKHYVDLTEMGGLP